MVQDPESISLGNNRVSKPRAFSHPGKHLGKGSLEAALERAIRPREKVLATKESPWHRQMVQHDKGFISENNIKDKALTSALDWGYLYI